MLLVLINTIGYDLNNERKIESGAILFSEIRKMEKLETLETCFPWTNDHPQTDRGGS